MTIFPRSPLFREGFPASLVVLACWLATAVAVAASSSKPEVGTLLESPIRDRIGDSDSMQATYGSAKSPRQRRRAEQDEAANDDNNMYFYTEYYASIFDTGYIRSTGCVSYTISTKDKGYDTLFPGISVVGQETVFFFEYVLPQNDDGDDAVDDDAVYGYYGYDDEYGNDDGQDDSGNNNDDDSGNNNNDDADQSQYNYDDDGHGGEESDRYLSNAILAKDWLVIFSIGELSTGCIEMVDPAGVFRDVVPGINDESLSFPSLYYGPVCGGTASKTSNKNNADFEIGIFLDSYCNDYVPGLSKVLNKYVLSGLSTEVSLRTPSSSSSGENDGDDDDAEEFSPYYQIHYDLQNLESFKTVIDNFNYYHNHESTNCEDHNGMCQQLSQASVDLDTCQPLADELLDEQEDNNDDEHNNDEDEGDDDGNNYGKIWHKPTDKSNNQVQFSFGSYFQMYQWVVTNYAAYISSDNQNYGSYEGFCYGVSKSVSIGYTLKEWLNDNARELRHEMKYVYKVGNNWARICFIAGIVVASCGAVLLLLEALGCSLLEKLLPIKSCSCRRRRRPSGETTGSDGSSRKMLFFTPRKFNDRSTGSLLDDDTRCTSLLELAPSLVSSPPSLVTSSSSGSSASSASFVFSSPNRNYNEVVLESIEVIFEGAKSQAVSGLKEPM